MMQANVELLPALLDTVSKQGRRVFELPPEYPGALTHAVVEAGRFDLCFEQQVSTYNIEQDFWHLHETAPDKTFEWARQWILKQLEGEPAVEPNRHVRIELPCHYTKLGAVAGCKPEFLGRKAIYYAEQAAARAETLRTFKRTRTEWPRCCGEDCVVDYEPGRVIVRCGHGATHEEV